MKKILIHLGSFLFVISVCLNPVYADEVSDLMKAAEQGNVDAQVKLGEKYKDGVDIKRDVSKAVYWYKKAAEQNNIEALLYLGYIYDYGSLVGPNEQQAVKKDKKEAMQFYEKAAKLGNIKAQNELANMYLEQADSGQNGKMAEQWFRQAANQGDPNALESLARMYRSGKGVKQDYVEAVKLYHKVAEQAHYFTAEFELGMLYECGCGVPQDKIEATKWLVKAADHGPDVVQAYLSHFLERNRGNSQIDIEAVKWHERRAKHDNAWSQYVLSTYYFEGEGISQNDEMAYMWVVVALAKDYPYAPRDNHTKKDDRFIDKKNEISAKMTEEQIERAEKAAEICLQSNYQKCTIE